MTSKLVEGTCHICGTYGPLTLEHVPPQKAFNSHPYIRLALEDALRLAPQESPKGPVSQGGVGAHTLCGRCNNDTGRWYGSHFVDWCYQGMELLYRSGGTPSLCYLHYIYPLSILKQIIAMFFSVNGDAFRCSSQDLVAFVLDKERRFLPPRFRVFGYFNLSGHFRYAGLSRMVRVEEGSTCLLSEIAHPPFGYVLTVNSSSPDARLVELSGFAEHPYKHLEPFFLPLRRLDIATMYPADYRSRDQVLKDAAGA